MWSSPKLDHASHLDQCFAELIVECRQAVLKEKQLHFELFIKFSSVFVFYYYHCHMTFNLSLGGGRE
ncbi:hypothetical protein BLA29_000233 [Euroglyphus maynei]|uniref:Uncharacterized protein n=1 Tax=Euroglyphus maynei TaxID=6958 RepID=A0A1Y3BBE8_EURMA|nr:hypothetical protein BLA29_000233 [Euroglyphus maynei]